LKQFIKINYVTKVSLCLFILKCVYLKILENAKNGKNATLWLETSLSFLTLLYFCVSPHRTALFDHYELAEYLISMVTISSSNTFIEIIAIY